jgi:hypothetical protein
MKIEKQIQDEVWEHISDNKTMKEMWSMPELQDGIKYIIESVVTKTIELLKAESFYGVGYQAGYEEATKNIRKCADINACLVDVFGTETEKEVI